MNTTLSTLPERALQLASQVGSGIKDAVPDKAIRWVETGAALGALRTGTRIATRIVRRNPAMTAAAVAGAGLLWYVARRKSQMAHDGSGRKGAIDGTSTRVEAKRASTGTRAKAGGNGTRARRSSSTASRTKKTE